MSCRPFCIPNSETTFLFTGIYIYCIYSELNYKRTRPSGTRLYGMTPLGATVQEAVSRIMSATGGRIAAGGGLFAAGLIAAGLFASGLNAATRFLYFKYWYSFFKFSITFGKYNICRYILVDCKIDGKHLCLPRRASAAFRHITVYEPNGS